LRIVFDKNVPVGVRRFLSKHEVRTFVEIEWHPQLENGEPLKAAEASGFDVLVTSDQNIRHQQNLTGRNRLLGLVASSENRTYVVGSRCRPESIFIVCCEPPRLIGQDCP
jgi:hypothetical protein